jgi:hypothetical protein
MGSGLAVTQPDPPVAEVLSSFVYGDATVTLMALRPGTVEVGVSGAFEKWVCPGTPTPVFPGPGCASTLHYTGTSIEVVVAGEEGPTVTPAPPVVFGDVDCDDAVTSIDATRVLQYEARLDGLPPCFHLGDLNGDCSLDAIDAAIILQVEAGFTSAPIPFLC